MSGARLAIVGLGKMGRAVDELAASHGFDVVARIGRDANAISAGSLSGAQVAIEFTEPAAAAANVRALLAAGCAVVTGTTGWSDQLAQVRKEVLRDGGALLWESNFSPGAHLMRALLESVASALRPGGGFAGHLTETHHAAKKDAPSGTANALIGHAASFGVELPVTSIRVGSVPGTHELTLDAQFEHVTISHVVRDRRVFASGALTAARWLLGKRGVFRMSDLTSEGVNQ